MAAAYSSSPSFGDSSGHASGDSSGYSLNPAFRQQAEAIRQRSTVQDPGQRNIKGKSQKAQAPKNVMELLVEEEIDFQLRQLSEKQRAAVQRPQVIAYALNRLPSLYVTSAKGWRRQWVRGKQALQKEIETTVRHALIAVQQDPLRAMSPVGDCLPEVAEAPMTQLRMLLQDPDLSWTTLVPTIQRLLVEGKMDFPDAIAKRPYAPTRPVDPGAGHRSDPNSGPNTNSNSDPNSDPNSGSNSSQMEITADHIFDWNSHPLHQRV